MAWRERQTDSEKCFQCMADFEYGIPLSVKKKSLLCKGSLFGKCYSMHDVDKSTLGAYVGQVI